MVATKRHLLMLNTLLMILTFSTGYADMNANTSMQGNIPPGAGGGSGSMSTNGTSISTLQMSGSDTSITATLQAKLIEDYRMTGSNIMVSTDSGVVTLTGTAATKAQADIAIKMAKSMNGVQEVDSEITVGSQGL
ncbi:MAG: BON domain-containing protein [Gammaproteobacteria bacterium]|nr:BON domain-containing protein [Gammaproteobacteria bacterium]